MNKINRPGYIPQLDALRAIAVLMVIIFHWMPASHFLNRYMPHGILGVTLFFVLSGYLITGILLQSKEMLSKGLPLKNAFIIFYARRSLRIFPVYYLFILLLLILHPAAIKPSLCWHVLYASNIYFWLHNAFAAQLSHLWSLAVEEQFYFVWPAIILLTRRGRLPAVFISGIVVALIFRAMMYAPPNHMGRLLMPGSLDSFSIGALLAYGQLYAPKWYVKLLSVKKSGFILMTGLMIAAHIGLQFYTGQLMVLIFYYFFISLFFFMLLLVVSVNAGKHWLSGLVLQNSALLYIGKISYGLYLFHLIIPNFNQLHLPSLLLAYSSSIILLLRFFLLITIASASWYFFEKPILALKNNFDIKPEMQNSK